MTTTTRILEHVLTRSLALAGLIGLSLTTCTIDAAAHTPNPQARVEGGLDKPAVRAVVAAHIGDIRRCYNAELVEDDSVAGDIIIAFTVAAAGSVHGVTITESTMPARFDACVAAAVGNWQFPSAELETRVSYPFAMAPG